jgi:hypothetical protein
VVAVGLVVALVPELVLVEVPVEEDVACELLLLVVDALPGFPTVPPPTEAGTVEPPAFCAAALNASSVSGLLRLRARYAIRTCFHPQRVKLTVD